MTRTMIDVTSADFEEQVLRASQPVLEKALGLCSSGTSHIGQVKE